MVVTVTSENGYYASLHRVEDFFGVWSGTHPLSTDLGSTNKVPPAGEMSGSECGFLRVRMSERRENRDVE
jgi:hypothetical protein